LGAKTQQNTQSTNVVGDNNSVEQNIHVYVADTFDLKESRLISDFLKTPSSAKQPAIGVETSNADETEEINRILAYREIANEGDSTTALKLLRDLKNDPKYKTGFVAFRLEFNTGVILQNIGEYQEASTSLRAAHKFCPEHPKAQSGLAFADLLDGKDEEAFERAATLLSTEGDHLNICAVIALHAAKRLERDFSIEGFELCDTKHPDVVAARLEHLRILRPDEYPAALKKAQETDPDGDQLASMWANAVLDDVKQNQAFLLGAKLSDEFERNVNKSSEILKNELEDALKQRPPNKLLLSSQANNAAVALRLAGKSSEASKLLDKTLDEHSNLIGELAQVRAVFFLQQDRDMDALQLIAPLVEHPDLQVMASEIEAKMGDQVKALHRINTVLKLDMPNGLKLHALATKARIGINSAERAAADEAIDELVADYANSPELILLKSAYSRAFELQIAAKDVEDLPVIADDQSASDQELLTSLDGVGEWSFFEILQAADELFARGYYRESAELLCDRVSFKRESPALQTLCDACLRGSMGTLAQTIRDSLSTEIMNSVFGWKFCANVGILTGEIVQIVPLTRKLFEENPSSLSALQWYVQSLLRVNDKNRINRLIKKLKDDDLTGTVAERREYTNLLVFCGEIERARSYAYRLFCENQNDHHSWMALSSSVLALGRPPIETDELILNEIAENAAIEVATPSGEIRKYVLEDNSKLFPLRQENIALDHPIAKAAAGCKQGDTFIWPLDQEGHEATVTSVKHKALEAFHFVIQRFEEKFPDADGFKSVKCDPSKEDGLDEIKAMLQQRAQYGQQKAKEYHEGSYPMSILGFHLGLDPIDTYLGLNSECGFPAKVSSCEQSDQDAAAAALKSAREDGILLDALAVYLLRRLEVMEAIEEEFGKIGVTQNTIDVFAKRTHEAETMGGYGEDGKKRSGHMSSQNGQIVLSEMSEDEINAKAKLVRSDLDWLKASCELIPAAAQVDPPNEIIRFRNEEGGRFFDDLFACDGSNRILISDDFHLRQWGSGLFKTRSAWIQALLFHLEETQQISTEKVVKATIQLLDAGEESLSVNSHRLQIGAEMLANGELSEDEFQSLCGLIGQPGAGMRSHIKVALETIHGLWSTKSLIPVRQRVTSLLLRKLVRNQGENSRVVVDTIQTLARSREVKDYIECWRIGHFT
jgi:predicted Zn-dependent protease